MSDVVIAFRSLRKQPRFSIVAILTIAIGIGALFSVYDRLVLTPTTIADPATLGALLNSTPQWQAPAASVSWSRFEVLRDRARSFASIGVSAFDNFTLTGNGEPDQLNG